MIAYQRNNLISLTIVAPTSICQKKLLLLTSTHVFYNTQEFPINDCILKNLIDDTADDDGMSKVLHLL